ncbi:hypothetical protein L3X38_041726 [Prunus dulcis]|uniref:Transposable element protein n=1 Tax=Prunus dulcis TaxID=3755 RepID=A0AAD4UUK5_PRUDU|nr:hypothetical protein L3X38_041726 [Prunus dulcis]
MDVFEDGGDSFDVEAARSNVQDSDPSNNNNAVATTHVGKIRRKLTSHVWTQFEILLVDPDNKLYAKCMKCGHKYLCDSKYVMAIIKHELPFQFVKYAGIRDVFNYICADIKLISRNTTKADVLSLYNRENGKLKKL